MINTLEINASGNIGQEPELRYTPSGKAVLGLSIAHNQRWTDDAGEKHEKTTWLKVTAWGKVAEALAKDARKGDRIIISGATPSVEAYTDRNGDVKGQMVATINHFGQYELVPRIAREEAEYEYAGDNTGDIPF